MKKIVLLLLPLFLLAGCISEDDLRFHHVKDLSVSIGTTTVVNAVLVVENSSGRNVTVSDTLFHVFDHEGSEIATLTVTDELLLPRRSITSLTVPVRIRFVNPLLGLGVLSDIERSAEKMTVTGSFRVKAGALKKNFKVENVPLSEFLSIFEGY